MKNLICTLLIALASSITILAQVYHGEMEGDVRIHGSLDIANKNDTTSLFIGLHSGMHSLNGTYYRNTILGSQAGNTTGFPVIGGVYGANNTLMGFRAGNAFTKGSANTIMGAQAGEKNTEGDDNIFLGHMAGNSNTTGEKNTYLGSNTGISSTGSNNTFVGYNAGGDAMGDGSVFLGNEAGKNATSTDNRLYISNTAGDNPLIYGEFNNNLVRINGRLETEDASIFMRNLGSIDTDQGIKWGEGNNDPIFGLVYDGEGNGASSELHLREYNSDDSDVMTFKADGNVKVHNLSGTATAPVYADAEGNLTRNSGEQVISIPAHMFTVVGDFPPNFRSPYTVVFQLELLGFVQMLASINLPNEILIKRIEVLYWDDSDQIAVEACLRRVEITANGAEKTPLICATTVTSAIAPNVLTLTPNEVVDNDAFQYDIFLNPTATGIPGAVIVSTIKIFYEY